MESTTEASSFSDAFWNTFVEKWPKLPRPIPAFELYINAGRVLGVGHPDLVIEHKVVFCQTTKGLPFILGIKAEVIV